MRFSVASTRSAVLLLIAALLLAGCGKTGPQAAPGGGPLQKLAPVAAEGAVGVATRNTTRVGGANAAADAAAVARVVYPGLTSTSRPQAVVVVDQRSWPAALAASSLAGAPLNAPILFAEGDSLPQVSLEALEAMHPTGAGTAGAQVIEIATHARLPGRYSVRAVPAAGPAPISGEIEQLLEQVQGGRPRQAIVMGTGGSRASQMPAAGLSAESGAPLLLTDPGSLSAATAAALTRLHRPAIYVMNGAAVGKAVLGALAKLGSVTRIPEAGTGESASPAAGAIAAARFTDGSFGWGVKEPGHGLVFANSARPLDAPAAALFSATGEYGPLLLLEAPNRIDPGLAAYLGNIQPAYTTAPEFRPVRGVYNHGWLVGDERTIALGTQAEIDSLLEISPRKLGGAEEAPAP
ncbi:MAG: hypothetical protein QOK19_1544 [Solirubrobacteraceae bacterium]|jgi:hypothetical protein|nr:hypothetical protein [Solirubrobacteraceae bacterium]